MHVYHVFHIQCKVTLQGDILALLGPTLLDIAHHVSGSDNSITVIFSARTVGSLVGSVSGGILYDKYRTKRYAMLSASIVISALCKWKYSYVICVVCVCMVLCMCVNGMSKSACQSIVIILACVLFCDFAVSMLIPFSPTLYAIIPAMFIQGIPMGFLDSG